VSALCPLSENTFLSGGFNRTVRLWDVRQRRESLKLFTDVSYGKVTALEKFNEEIFASAAEDGMVNIWNTRMNKLIGNV